MTTDIAAILILTVSTLGVFAVDIVEKRHQLGSDSDAIHPADQE